MTMAHKIQLATLCYVRNGRQTLMLHRVKKQNDMHHGKWNGLGGKLEAGETPEECAIREVKEESGLKAEHLILKGFLTFPMFDGRKDWYVFVFLIDRFSGRLIESPEGFLKWVDNDQLLELPLWEGDRIFLPWLDQEKIFSAKFIYQEKRLIDYTVEFY